MRYIAVITADVVASRNILPKHRTKLYTDLETFIAQLQTTKIITQYEFSRGDSFQCITNKNEQILKIALLLRCFIISYTYPRSSATYNHDVRMGIGVGQVDFLKKTSLAHSDGEAFYLSGGGLDNLKKMPYNLALKTYNHTFNQSIEPSILLLDALMQAWTTNQAQTIFYLLQNFTEEEIALKLKISQSAVNQRKKAANWYAVQKLLHYFQNTVTNIS